MDEDLNRRLASIELKLEQTYAAAEKSRRYLMWTGIVSVAVFVIPLLISLFAIPWFISTYTASLGDQQDIESLMQGL
jgi:hypothetical protein